MISFMKSIQNQNLKNHFQKCKRAENKENNKIFILCVDVNISVAKCSKKKLQKL